MIWLLDSNHLQYDCIHCYEAFSHRLKIRGQKVDLPVKCDKNTCRYYPHLLLWMYSLIYLIYILMRSLLIHLGCSKLMWKNVYCRRMQHDGWDAALTSKLTLFFFLQESPPLVRNSPLVAGAITWSRALLKKIEDPMKIFKENKFITSYRVRSDSSLNKTYLWCCHKRKANRWTGLLVTCDIFR